MDLSFLSHWLIFVLCSVIRTPHLKESVDRKILFIDIKPKYNQEPNFVNPSKLYTVCRSYLVLYIDNTMIFEGISTIVR